MPARRPPPDTAHQALSPLRWLPQLGSDLPGAGGELMVAQTFPVLPEGGTAQPGLRLTRRMLVLLHTARVHVETFERLARELDDRIPIRHEVRESLLADALAAGKITDAVRAATMTVVQSLARDGARVIVCTCSTIGAVAEAAQATDGVRVMRIDRPMAEQAAASGRRVVVVAALRSTFEPTLALLRQVAAGAERSLELAEVWCERAWPLFERGDRAGYIGEIAATIEATARPDDLVLLAQASMAAAAERVTHLGIPVLSSPRLGLQAAMSWYRAG